MRVEKGKGSDQRLMEEIAVVMHKFGDEQSTLLDQFERLTFEVQLNQAILGRSLSEPSTARPQAAQPLAPPVRQGGRRRGSGLRKVLKKLLRPILGRKGTNREVPNPRDPRVLKAFSRSLRNPTESALLETFHIEPSNLVQENGDGLTSKDEEQEQRVDLDFDKRSSRLRVQKFVDRIRALPTSERIQYVNVVVKDGGIGTISGFNDLLLALLITEEPELALKVFDNLPSYGVVPDSWTFSVVIRCHCKKNDPTEAKRVLDHMVGNGFQANVVTFTILINSFSRRGMMQKAFEVFEVMGRVGCEPSVQTHNCLIKGLCYVGRVEEAFEFFMNIKISPQKPDIYSYTTLMDGFCKVGRTDEAKELLNEAVEMGLTPNAVTFNTLFNGYCKEGRPLEGIGLLEQMKGRNCCPDYISYNTLLHTLLKWGKVPKALQIYREMVATGFDLDERLMNTLLRGLCRRSWKEENLLKDAYELFEKMRDGVSVIYLETYEVVIRTLCIKKEMNSALYHLHEIIMIGHSPRTTTFNVVIQALCNVGMVKEALRVLVLMCEGRRIPSRISYNLLIAELNRQGRLQGAFNVYGAALKVGLVPSRKPGKFSTEIKSPCGQA
ncbi:pentatricopeptide repeat-containing protein At1g62680, mitochondrial-like [Malania oleifera]|uniref:pentatricopeptide repeat-containing protein At1g62680, mitochondrial-like n=1 Tax=Malania oleifera TaxID=397392 RepID=UPI0025AE15B2|nr:pentatricopeptide repeat-containing protein At1g62680, mitochondrial-like [Malania oleifera]